MKFKVNMMTDGFLGLCGAEESQTITSSTKQFLSVNYKQIQTNENSQLDLNGTMHHVLALNSTSLKTLIEIY